MIKVQSIQLFLLLILPLNLLAQKTDCSQIIKIEGKYYADDFLFSGVCLSHYDNGIVSSRAIYLNGEPSGVWTWWWDNGEKKKELTYTTKNGYYNISGIVNHWFSNGQLMQKEIFKNGLRNGDWYKYDLKGNVIMHGVYMYGEHISGDKVPVPVSSLRS